MTFRKLFAAVVLLTAGFIGGLLLTARLHISNNTIADELNAPAPMSSRLTASPPAASAAPAPVTTTGLAVPGPDFTHIAGQAVKGVANISSLQVVRTPNSPFAADPFFRYFFGDADMFGTRDRRSLS